MIMNGWSIALIVCSSGVIFLGLLAVFCGIKVLRFWNHGSDTSRQIRLENEIWLTASLMQYGLVFQILSLLLLVLAADSFSSILIGAMCATGAFLANSYGIPALLVKILLIFFCGYWLILHRLDMMSESYPLVRIKYTYLLFLVPLLGMEAILQFSYLYNLEPDVITSCCGVIFRQSNSDGYNLLGSFSTPLLLSLFYGQACVIVLLGLIILFQIKRGIPSFRSLMTISFSVCWTLFFVISIWVIINVFSSYIYAMPSHRCPFDILQSEYNFIGYPIYLTLFLATFLGTGCGVAHMVRRYDSLASHVSRFQFIATAASLLLLIVFLLLTAYAPLQYILAGGEV